MKLIAAIIVWLSVLVALLWYSGSGQLSHFSPNNTVIESKELVDLVKSNHPVNKPILLHFFDQECRCNLVAEPHINSVKALAQKQQFTNVYIDINEHPKWKSRIPSTPAVLAINNNQLQYFGPYSTGPSCLPGEGLIEPYLTTPTTKPQILTDGFGCYCNTGA